MEIYCHAHHASHHGPLCEECQALFEYAQARLGKCPFGPEKPVCSNCPIHCYQPAMRDQIREVMRYAGPRMTLRHPVLALSHLLQKSRPVPERGRRGAKGKPGAPNASQNSAESPTIEFDQAETKSIVDGTENVEGNS